MHGCESACFPRAGVRAYLTLNSGSCLAWAVTAVTWATLPRKLLLPLLLPLQLEASESAGADTQVHAAAAAAVQLLYDMPGANPLRTVLAATVNALRLDGDGVRYIENTQCHLRTLRGRKQ